MGLSASRLPCILREIKIGSSFVSELLLWRQLGLGIAVLHASDWLGKALMNYALLPIKDS
jgi:hypothetical protein